MNEISTMQGNKCILQLRGTHPFFSDKYDITKHKNYKYLSDYDKDNAFDIAEFVNVHLDLQKENLEQVVTVKLWSMDNEK